MHDVGESFTILTPHCPCSRQRCPRVRASAARCSVPLAGDWTPRAAPRASATTRASLCGVVTASSAGRCPCGVWPARVRPWPSACRPWPTRAPPGGRCREPAAAPASRRVRAVTCATSAPSANTTSAVPSPVSIEGESGLTYDTGSGERCGDCCLDMVLITRENAKMSRSSSVI